MTLNSIGDAVLTTNLPGNVTYLNLVAEAMTGWSWENAIGRPLAEVFNIVDGATRKAAPILRSLPSAKIVPLGWLPTVF